jgi:hypothetical protein
MMRCAAVELPVFNVLTIFTVVLSIVGGVSTAEAQPFAVSIPQGSDPLMQNLTIPATATSKGMWSAAAAWPLVPIHGALLPDGRILTFGSPLSDPAAGATQGGQVFDVWDPLSPLGWSAHRSFTNAVHVDSFCAAATLLPTGQLLRWEEPTEPTGHQHLGVRFEHL